MESYSETRHKRHENKLARFFSSSSMCSWNSLNINKFVYCGILTELGDDFSARFVVQCRCYRESIHVIEVYSR